MRRAAIYCRSERPAEEPQPPAPATSVRRTTKRWPRLSERLLYLLGGAMLLCAVAAFGLLAPLQKPLTPQQLRTAIEKTLQSRREPAAAAYEAVRDSVVMVRALNEDTAEHPRSAGSGVVLVDSGIILTNLHVVRAGKRLEVLFADGTRSEAEIVAGRPEQDLAILRALTPPADLRAATLGSTADLHPGDEVVAVGFPFGIGPSVSAGVVSGLEREQDAGEGGETLSHLIQFDAAANPGNSGGPLVNSRGEVVGVVTGILNPTAERVFIGIGFAVPIETAAAAAGAPPF